jgi:hypothetical protein
MQMKTASSIIIHWTQSFATAAILFFASLTFAGEVFSFQNLRDSTVSGPYRLHKGDKVRLGGITYEVLTPSQGRVSFKSLSNGVVYGPIQAVDGRIGVVGNASYCLRAAADDAAVTPPPQPPANVQSEPFVPQPPAMPTLIEVPEQQKPTLVKPKQLRPLPKSQEVLRFWGWLAPLDNTSVDWKIASSKSGDGEIERTSIGGDVEWNNWMASVSLSPTVECGDIASGGTGIRGASIEEGTGWSIEAGYRRALLSEGGWTAKAGLRGQIRQESGDLTVLSLIRSEETDTNGVVTAKSERRTQTSSITIRELSLWIDLELAYSEDNWGTFAIVSFQPVSDYNVSSSIHYGEIDLSLDAERPQPLDVTVGGWYGFDRWRLFADLTLASDTRFRIGCGYDF